MGRNRRPDDNPIEHIEITIRHANGTITTYAARQPELLNLSHGYPDYHLPFDKAPLPLTELTISFGANRLHGITMNRTAPPPSREADHHG